MRTGIKTLMMALLFGLVIPGIILNGIFGSSTEHPPVKTEPNETEAVSPLLLPVLTSQDETVLMGLEEYVVGVLLKEIPFNFHSEAMKAQAVAARTYALRRFTRGFKHETAAVCTDPACCQAYRSPEIFLAEGGTQSALRQIRAAVADTSGKVLCYGGQLIEATYFSSSGGMTEAAVAVWGQDIPYLQATESPGEESAMHHTDTLTFSWEEVANRLDITLSGAPESRFTDIRYTAGGGVEAICVCNHEFSGKQMRNLLGLRSTAFSIYPSDNGITVVTRGYGHRVGMSQYGADAMAADGCDYVQILSHYYCGAELTDYVPS